VKDSAGQKLACVYFVLSTKTTDGKRLRACALSADNGGSVCSYGELLREIAKEQTALARCYLFGLRIVRDQKAAKLLTRGAGGTRRTARAIP
jgi:hypothetical protein